MVAKIADLPRDQRGKSSNLSGALFDFWPKFARHRGCITSGMTTTSFRDLQVWQESMLLVEDIYRITQKFPREERYGLTSQLRGAAISIPSNIGEGARRKRRKAFLNHLDIALGSQGEVDVQVEVGKRLNFGSVAELVQVQPRIDRIGRMLNGLIVSLQPDARFWEE